MLDLLSKITGANAGIGVVSYSGSSSDLFLQLHYCSSVLTQKKRILILSTNMTESNYKMMFGKLALRWDPSLITVLELDSLCGSELRVNTDKMLKALSEVVDSETPQTLLIFDDVSVLERLGLQPFLVVSLLHRLYSRLKNEGLLLASFSLKTKAYDIMVSKADFTIDITPIGLGYGKDVTGKMSVNIWNEASTPSASELLYLTGDRSIKCFYPGGNSFLSV